MIVNLALFLVEDRGFYVPPNNIGKYIDVQTQMRRNRELVLVQ